MKIYLVGGAVRDKILGIPHKEKDYVVIGASVEDMLKLNYRPVGKDFPVFLHPETNEEYALARIERKTGRGYAGFSFDTSQLVTLEEDLKRRDLTINAMAETLDGKELIDPYHGQRDLKEKILRHVSPAFIEDPVRILRVARFAARYSEFTVAPETMELMRQMVQSGEVNALVAERVWKELERALAEMQPKKFFIVLDECGALAILFPQLTINSAGMQVLDVAAKASSDITIRFAVLLHDIPEAEIKNLCTRYRIPTEPRDLALLVSRHLNTYRRIHELSAAEILDVLQAVDAFRREERFKKFLRVCEITSSLTADTLWNCCSAAKSIDLKALLNAGYSGNILAEKIKEQRIQAISAFIQM